MFTCEATNRALFEAAVGLFGSSCNLGPVRKSLHPTTVAARTSPTIADGRSLRIDMRLIPLEVMAASPGQDDGEYERPGLRVVEEVDAPGAGFRPGEIGLRVHAGVVGPHREVPAGQPQVNAREPELAGHEPAPERIAHRYFAQLHEAAVLVERLADGAGEGPAVVVGKPVLIQNGRRSRPGSGDSPR